MSDKSYQGRKCPARDCAMSVETDVNIRWCQTCSTRPKPLTNLDRKSHMYPILFFLPNILVKDLQMWKHSQVLHAFHDSYFSFVEGDFA
jgi:hypothetical protein